jgi:glycosyltransferase involved in cell wall biosynthesis
LSLTRLVSVIIPCYNQAQFLGEAIESVLAQSYEPLEIIVIDDGSSDNTAEVARRYPAAKYFHQKNAGRSAARNAGLRRSRGELVVFLDADDRLLPAALDTGVQCLEKHAECAFVSGHCRVIDSTGTVLAEPRQRVVEREHYLQLLRGGNYIWCPATVVYRRRVFDFVHGFDPSLVPVEDYDVYLRVTKDFAAHCHGEVVAEYRQHSGNTSRDFSVMQKAAIAAHEAQWPVARANRRFRAAYRAGERFWRDHYPIQHMIRRIRELVRERLAPNAIVAVAPAGQNELLRLDARETWYFPPADPSGAGGLFAQGAQGSVQTPAWIEAGMTYRFTLVRATDPSRPLARLVVRGVPDGSVVRDSAVMSPQSASANGVVLSADPNPVVVRDKPGSTTITWSTGDGSEGQLYVTGNQPGLEPANSAEAWQALEVIREQGAQYLLLPAKSFCRFPEFGQFRDRLESAFPVIAREEHACTIFDLRDAPQ